MKFVVFISLLITTHTHTHTHAHTHAHTCTHMHTHTHTRTHTHTHTHTHTDTHTPMHTLHARTLHTCTHMQAHSICVVSVCMALLWLLYGCFRYRECVVHVLSIFDRTVNVVFCLLLLSC